MDQDSAIRVVESVEIGGAINPTVLAVAIRTAVRECTDNTGKVSLAALYELTCELEKKGKGGIIRENN